MIRHSGNRDAAAWLLLLLVAAVSMPAGASDALRWHAGRLHADDEKSPAVREVVDLINRHDFDEALQRIGTSDMPDAQRGLLAMAVGGHLDMPFPDRALADARVYLERARGLADADAARRLLNRLDVYEALAGLVLPWAASSPGHVWIPTPNLLPARDAVLEDRTDDGLATLAKETGRPHHPLNLWYVTSHLSGRADRRADYERLLAEIDAALPRPADGLDRIQQSQLALRPLLETARAHDWAVMTVPPDALLYPRSMLEPMKTYYWWFRQMGSVRPMAKQGFEEIRDRIRPLFPDNVLVKIYSGQKVPWGADLRPDAAGAPKWAADQVELRRRADHVGAWWFTERQAPNGELGGGWEDDCESMRRFALTPILCGNPVIEAGMARLVDGIWSSGELVNGYDRVLKDIEHSCEMSGDSSIMIAVAYGDPLYVERMLETTRTTERLHTAVNAHGHRHYRSASLSATQVGDDGFDVLYAGRAMRPAAMLAWYSGLPKSVELVEGWARAWTEDAMRESDGKPAGVYPAVVRFSDERITGHSTWQEGLGGLYKWSAHDQDMVYGKVLLAWMTSGDDALLAPIRRQFEMWREHRRAPEKKPASGSPAWTRQAVSRSAPRFALWHRAVTGDSSYDDLVSGHSAFGKLLSGEPVGVMDGFHDRELNHMRFNLPMISSEVRGTDRIDLQTFTLTGPLSGSWVDLVQPPTFPVTWRVGADFAGVVQHADAASVRAIAYSFADAATRPTMRLWRLDPGRYELRVGADADADGRFDSDDVEKVPFERRHRLSEVAFDLPSRTQCLVQIVQLEKGEALPRRRPDLAVMPRDVTLDGAARAGRTVRGRVVVHNIGSADAMDLRVRVTARLQGSGSKRIADVAVASLACPSDLVAKTAEATFAWTPRAAGAHVLHVEVETDALEIHDGNNSAAVEVEVAR
ncbi:MAG: hypothetical protein CMJ18_05085 [Phycisphaeraceae bacterium]|nr:hypothetical protein [Phycisphaeraceae bacterium]